MPTTTKSMSTYVELFRGKSDYEIGKIILSDLLGYRSNSLKVPDDLDTLRSAIKALHVRMAAKEQSEDKGWP